MDEANLTKKRSRPLTGSGEPDPKEVKTPCEKTAPKKWHTHSQSRRRGILQGESRAGTETTTQRNLTEVVDLIIVDEEEEEALSQKERENEAASVKNLADTAKFF